MCGRPRTATVKEKTSREVFGMQIKQKLSFTSFTCPEAVWSGSICTFYEVAWLGWAETPTDATHADASSRRHWAGKKAGRSGENTRGVKAHPTKVKSSGKAKQPFFCTIKDQSASDVDWQLHTGFPGCFLMMHDFTKGR